MLYCPNPALWSSGTSLPCVFGALPHRRSGHSLTLCRHLQRRPDTDSQQRTSAEGNLSSCLCSSHPTTFIISSSLRTLQSSIISASSLALLVFGTDLTTALQCIQRCFSTQVFPSSFLPARCLTRRLLRSQCMNAVMCFYFPLTHHAGMFTCDQHLRCCWNRKYTLFLSIYVDFSVMGISGYLIGCRIQWRHSWIQQICRGHPPLFVPQMNHVFACEWILQTCSNRRPISRSERVFFVCFFTQFQRLSSMFRFLLFQT